MTGLCWKIVPVVFFYVTSLVFLLSHMPMATDPSAVAAAHIVSCTPGPETMDRKRNFDEQRLGAGECKDTRFPNGTHVSMRSDGTFVALSVAMRVAVVDILSFLLSGWLTCTGLVVDIASEGLTHIIQAYNSSIDAAQTLMVIHWTGG